MAYLGLARKWRPQIFSDLVGQDHIAQTLSNAIRKNRISQGYLFTGTRGIGKTSAARILAKALRCPTPVEPGLPCNKCQDCIEISEGRSIDVLEIDGASNNGVDSVREIRDNVKFLPSTGKMKVYIIDEVHMLTTAAFNALLKTLEEPPAHIVFIFATTDPQKIPDTVLSRCQRFDFKRVSQKDLKERLQIICKSEGLKISDDAVVILSREAEGSMRDAVSLLDQVLSISEGKKELSAEMISNALGLIDRQTVLNCIDGIIKRDALKALDSIGRIYMHGFDLKQFGRELLRILRTIMVARLLEQNNASAQEYLDLTDMELADIKPLISLRPVEELEMLFRMLSQGLEEVSRSQIPKMLFDVLIIKMAASVGSTSSSSEVKPSTATPTVKTEVQPPLQTQSKAPASLDLAWWKNIILHMKTQKPLFGTMLEHFGFETARSDGEALSIRLLLTRDSLFYREQLDQQSNKDALIATLKGITGKAVKLEYVENLNSDSIAKADEDEKQNRYETKKKQVLDSEAFQATQRLLGAKLEKLELKGE